MKTGPHLCAALLALAAFVVPVRAAPADPDRLKVVATFSIIGDFARVVGGDRIDLVTLVGPNGDAHVYEPRPSDAMALARADVVLVNGLQFEGFLSRLIAASGTRAPVVELTDGAEILRDPDGGHHHHYGDRSVFHPALHDPHAWQSVANAKVYVGNVAKSFCAADVQGCPTYEANARAYREELAALDREIRRVVAAIPEERRTVVVAHNAFRYFEHAYGLTFLAPQGLSTDAEASAADVAGLIREIRPATSAVFSENVSDGRLVRRIAAEAGLAFGGMLHSDALSQPDGPAATYLDLMRHNLATIEAALAGD